MMQGDIIGYVAAALTTSSFLPQAILIWKTRNVESISLGMYSILSAGVFLWLLYGLMIHSWPVAAANGVTLLFTSFILGMKLRYRS